MRVGFAEIRAFDELTPATVVTADEVILSLLAEPRTLNDALVSAVRMLEDEVHEPELPYRAGVAVAAFLTSHAHRVAPERETRTCPESHCSRAVRLIRMTRPTRTTPGSSPRRIDS